MTTQEIEEIKECDDGNYTNFNPIFQYTGIFPDRDILNYTKKITYNEYEFTDLSGNQKECFKKFIPLVDFVKFLIGKYRNENIQQLPVEHPEQIPSTEDKDNLFKQCIQSPHNYAYVDGFFYYLTSKLKKKGFQHGIELYDSYICIKNNFEIDIADDFEYIGDSNFFNEKLNQLFHFKDENISTIFNKDTKLDPICISEEVVDFDIDDLDNMKSEQSIENESNDTENPFSDFDMKCLEQEIETIHLDMSDLGHSMNPILSEITTENDSLTEVKDLIIDETDTMVCKQDNDDNSDIDNSDDDNNSNISYTDDEEENDENEEDEEDEYGTTDDESSFHGSIEDELQKLILVIHQIPTQVIAIEKCKNTFDSLLDKNDIKIEELESAIFQIIVILYVYQSIFKFTHNDLHTNNIMYVNTDMEYVTYKIKGTLYKIPTFGRLFKIIDFGRSIYTVNDKIVCSDSFSENGMAHTQYNFEPFYNPNKPVIKPNYSFDLCRLACSMLDFIIDDLDDIEKFKQIPIYNLIISWIYDDNGINVLYKRNGEERYPDFKLYKMISRIVHNHIPEKQFDHECFKKYISDDSQIVTMDLDELITMY